MTNRFLLFLMESSLHYINGAEDGEAFLTGIAPDHAEPSYTAVAPRFIYKDPENSDALRFACCARVISTDGTVASDGARVYVNGASYALLAVRAGTSYAGFRVPRDRDAGKVLEELRKGLDHVENTHRRGIRVHAIFVHFHTARSGSKMSAFVPFFPGGVRVYGHNLTVDRMSPDMTCNGCCIFFQISPTQGNVFAVGSFIEEL